jgi:hypothetical protein
VIWHFLYSVELGVTVTKSGLSRAVAVGLFAGLLTGCSQANLALENVFSFGSNDELAAAEKMPPAEMPVYAPEDTYVFKVGENLIEEKVVSVSPDRVVWTNDRGLIWTVGREVVTPALSWSANAELGRGRQTIIGSPSQLFPLETGNTVSFGVRGSSENLPNGWQETQVCEVGPQEMVAVAAGDFRTFKIICQREDHVDIIYYAPQIQHYALRIRRHDTTEDRKELVSFRLNEMPETALSKASAPDMQAAMKPIDLTTQKMPPSQSEPPSGMVIRTEADQTPEPEGGVDVLTKRVDGLSERVDEIEKKLLEQIKSAASENTSEGMSDGKYGVHLASYRNDRGAKRGWKVLKAKFKTELMDKVMVIRAFDSGNNKGTFQRLIAGYFESRASATAFCKALKLKRQFCSPVRARP